MKHEHALSHAAKGGAPSKLTAGASWVNELGSVLTITQTTGDSFTGTYTSAVSGSDQPVTGAVSGYAKGGLVTFLADFNGVQAITAWAGQIEQTATGFQLATLWQMTQILADPKQQDWASINAGSDTFVPQ